MFFQATGRDILEYVALELATREFLETVLEEVQSIMPTGDVDVQRTHSMGHNNRTHVTRFYIGISSRSVYVSWIVGPP